ncbi:MAG: IS256 family transposase [Kosmotoga sp.]|nr:MAG: IS256 family transposase [Kosmotoga sp.]
MKFTKVQLQTLISNHLKRENGLNEVLEMTLNAMMKAERTAHLQQAPGNKANGYRMGRAYGNGRLLELRIPRDRNGEFYPKVLALLRDQQHESDRLVSSLYGQGLTQQQVGEVFEQLYGRRYSASTVGRMIEWMHQDVADWLARPLQARYPVVFIDAIQVKVRRDTVQSEAFYVVLGVTEQGTREVLGIAGQPTESATGWRMLLKELADRGLSSIGLVVADGLQGLPEAVARVYPAADFQRCVTHLKRELLARVRSEDKPLLAEDLREVFATDRRQDSPRQGWQRWQQLCTQWAGKYPRFDRLKTDAGCRACFSYLRYDWRMRSMIYTTNWIERLNRDFRRVLRMRASLPGEKAVLTLLGTVAMNKEAYKRKVPRLTYDKSLFGSPLRRGDIIRKRL